MDTNVSFTAEKKKKPFLAAHLQVGQIGLSVGDPDVDEEAFYYMRVSPSCVISLNDMDMHVNYLDVEVTLLPAGKLVIEIHHEG